MPLCIDRGVIPREVAIATRASSCLADTLVLGATWYTTGSIHMFARRAQKESSLTSLLLVDGVFHCDQLCLPALSVELIRYHLFLVRKISCGITFFIQNYNISIILIANVATLTCYIINVCSASSSISP